MTQILRQSTQVVVRIGVAVAVGDGFTPVTTLDLSTADEAELLKAAGAATSSLAAATFAAITGADGWYNLTLTTTHTDTVGTLDVVVNDDSLILPIYARFQVIEEAVYDAMYAASAVGPLLANSNGSGLTEAGGTGDHLTAINLPNQTMDITGNITGNLSGSVGSVTGAVGSVTAKVSANVIEWLSSPVLSVGVAGTPKVDVTHWISVAAATPTVGGVPEVDVTHYAGLTTNVSTIPASVAEIKVQTDKFVFTVANQVDANTLSLNSVALTGDGSATPWGPA